MTAIDVEASANGAMSSTDAAPYPHEGIVRRFFRRILTGRAVHATRFVFLLVVLGVWQVIVGDPADRFVVFDSFFVAKPSGLADTLWHWITDGPRNGPLLTHIWVTVQEAIIGFTLGSTAGLVVGLALGISVLTSNLLKPFVLAIYAVPRLALAPLLVLWFGLGMGSKVALVALTVFFLVFFNTYSGARDIDQGLVDVLRIMGARRWHIHLKATLPSVVAWVVAGLRISVPYAFVAAVVGEFIAANQGLGFLIMNANNSFNADGIFAAITLVVMLSILLDGVVSLAERRLLRWKRASARGGDSSLPI